MKFRPNIKNRSKPLVLSFNVTSISVVQKFLKNCCCTTALFRFLKTLLTVLWPVAPNSKYIKSLPKKWNYCLKNVLQWSNTSMTTKLVHQVSQALRVNNKRGVDYRIRRGIYCLQRVLSVYVCVCLLSWILTKGRRQIVPLFIWGRTLR